MRYSPSHADLTYLRRLSTVGEPSFTLASLPTIAPRSPDSWRRLTNEVSEETQAACSRHDRSKNNASIRNDTNVACIQKATPGALQRTSSNGCRPLPAPNPAIRYLCRQRARSRLRLGFRYGGSDGSGDMNFEVPSNFGRHRPASPETSSSGVLVAEIIDHRPSSTPERRCMGGR